MGTSKINLGPLSKLKAWLSIPEAAACLSRLFEEPVSEADVLQFGLEGHLKLSVRFVDSAYAKLVRPPRTQQEIEKRMAQFADLWRRKKAAMLGGPPFENPYSPDPDSEKYNKIYPIQSGDIFELSMEGAGRFDVEHAYQERTGGPDVRNRRLIGVVLESADGTRFKLQEPGFGDFNPRELDGNDFFSAQELPEAAVLVVRMTAIEHFLHAIVPGEPEAERPLMQRERRTLYVLIAAFMKKQGIDWQRPSKAAEVIALQTQLVGQGVGVRTIEEHLKRIPDALAGKE
jgi:hypothetical protein